MFGLNTQGTTPAGTAGARHGDAAGHHQDTARVPWQVGSSPHTDPARWHSQLSPTHMRSQLPPALPSQACCRCVVSRKLIIEQQGVLGARLPAGQTGPQQGRWQRPVCYADGTEHTCAWPQAMPRKALPLDRHRPHSAKSVPSTLPSLSQPTRQAVHIKNMQHINKISWNLKKGLHHIYVKGLKKSTLRGTLQNLRNLPCKKGM